MEVLHPLPVALPLAGAGLSMLLSRFPAVQRLLAGRAGRAARAAVSLLVVVDRDGTQVVQPAAGRAGGHLARADRLAALLLVVSAAVLLAVLVYAIGQAWPTAAAACRSRCSTRATSCWPPASRWRS
jgi:multicomponent Na+:H+ antiporter subunit D